MPPLGYEDALHRELIDTAPTWDHAIDPIIEQTLVMLKIYGVGESHTESYTQVANILSYLYETRRKELDAYMARKYDADTTNMPKSLLLQMLNV
jgi:hypothetical protein